MDQVMYSDSDLSHVIAEYMNTKEKIKMSETTMGMANYKLFIDEISTPCNMKHRDAQHIIELISKLKNIHSLHFHFSFYDTVLNNHVRIENILDSIHNMSDIKKFSMNVVMGPHGNHSPLSHESYANIVAFIKKCKNMTDLNFSHNYHWMPNNILIDLIQSLPSLHIKKLSLGSNHLYVRPNICPVIREVLPQCNYLRTLDLSKNRLGDRLEDMNQISQSIYACPHLRTINLSYNAIADNSTKFICLMLKNKSLKKCILKHNFIQHGLFMILKTLSEESSVQYLDLTGNKLVDMYNLTILKNRLPFCKNLKYLNISRNYIKDEGAICLSQGFETYVHLACLDMSSNYIEKKGAMAIAKHLHKFNGSVILKGNFFQEEGRQAIRDAVYNIRHGN